MKNLFNKKEDAAKATRVSPPLPFSQSGSQGSNYDKASKPYQEKKTRIGRQPDVPFPSKSENVNLACPKCQYPLRIEPSASSPCPNCGFSGADEIHDTVSDSKKTILLHDLDLQDEERLPAFRFKLISEPSGSEFKIESEEDEIILNRDHLAPNNTSISSNEHLRVKFLDGKIFIQDVSTNGSTYIQVKKKMPVEPGTRIVMGNRIYLFSSGHQVQDSVDYKATRQLGRINLDNDENKNFMLIEEGSGRKILLIPGVNLLNRKNLDPGNASISGNKHAELAFIDNQWYIRDLSSNAATFLQCKKEEHITDKVRIIIGNIIFRFEYD